MVYSFRLYDQTGSPVALEDYKKKWVVLYFYPKNSVSFAKVMLEKFCEYKNKFKRRGATILLINPESVSSNFMLPYREIKILSDPGKDVMRQYNVIMERELESKVYETIIPTIFLIGPSLELVRKWENAREPYILDEVLKTIDLIKSHSRLSKR